MQHITVLKTEAVTGLNLNQASVVVDATLGGAGHAEAILSQIGPSGRFVGLDADPKAISLADNLAKSSGAKVELVNANFKDLDSVLDSLGIDKVDAVLADLGWRTDQFLELGRGFSFNDDTALTMTYGHPDTYVFTASDIVNDWEEESISDILYGYGEERQSRRIAKAIVEARKKAPITNAKQLANIIEACLNPRDYKHHKIHPATKSFQAIRIAVNDEFSVLEKFIAGAWTRLRPNGRLAIITFHSLEDRIVKHTFRSLTHDQQGVLVTKKPITPSLEECKFNSRARSAKLRIISKN